jgi:hypothetical protein
MANPRRGVGWGGKRPGAGRPRKQGAVSHLRRGDFDPRQPLHVTMQVDRAVGSLRRPAVIRAVHDALAAGGSAPDFRVVEFAVHDRRLHLLAEADGAAALSRGMQGLLIRLARRINAALRRRGRVFAERYQATPLGSPAEVRAALRAVLLGHIDRAAPRRDRARAAIDPFSSALWFDGWRARVRLDEAWQRRLLTRPRPTAPATLPLLTDGWKALGLLGADELPDPAPDG